MVPSLQCRVTKIGFEISKPGSFTPNQRKVISYTASDALKSLAAVNVPSKWKVQIDMDNDHIEITAPKFDDLYFENTGGTIVILASDGAERTSIHNLTVGIHEFAESTTAGANFTNLTKTGALSMSALYGNPLIILWTAWATERV